MMCCEQEFTLPIAGAAEVAANTAAIAANTAAIALARTYAWTWADAAARTAQAVSAADVGAVGYQSDIALQYRLLGVSPTRWAPLVDPSMGPAREWRAIVNSSALTSSLGLAMSATFGTAGTRAPTATTPSTRETRLKVETAVGAGSIAVVRNSTNQTSFAAGGLRRRIRFVLGDVCASMRWCVAVGPAIIATNVNPSTILNLIGFAAIDGQANVHLVRGDASAAATPIDLGVAFPARTLDIGYEADFYTFDGTTSYGWQLRHLDTGAVISGLSTTNLPVSTTFVYSTLYASNNTDGEVISLDPGSVIEWYRTH